MQTQESNESTSVQDAVGSTSAPVDASPVSEVKSTPEEQAARNVANSQEELMNFFNELKSDEIQLVFDEFEDEYEQDDLKLFRLYHYCKIAF